jgi:hypothetical protein
VTVRAAGDSITTWRVKVNTQRCVPTTNGLPAQRTGATGAPEDRHPGSATRFDPLGPVTTDLDTASEILRNWLPINLIRHGRACLEPEPHQGLGQDEFIATTLFSSS